MASQQSELLSTFHSGQSIDLDTSSLAPSQASFSINNRKRPRTSKIWDHTPEHREFVFLNASGKALWRCKYCRQEYLETSGTAVCATHLRIHGVDIASVQAIKTLSRQASINEVFQRVQEGRGQAESKRRKLGITITETMDPATLEHLYVRWIVACGISFRMVTREEFREYALNSWPMSSNH